MTEVMTFPKTINEFIDNYSFFDEKQIYTNGGKLIPVFRIYQALIYYAPELFGENN